MDENTVGNEMDRLLQEDISLGAEIARVERARDIRIQFHHRQGKEAAAEFEGEIAPLKEKREVVRQAILDAWAREYPDRTTLDLPCGKVSRRNYRDLAVHDRMALLYALDRIERLDLVEFVFDGPAVARLVVDGALPDLPTGAVTVTDRYNLQVRPKNASRADVPARRAALPDDGRGAGGGRHVERRGPAGDAPGAQISENDHDEDLPTNS